MQWVEVFELVAAAVGGGSALKIAEVYFMPKKAAKDLEAQFRQDLMTRVQQLELQCTDNNNKLYDCYETIGQLRAEVAQCKELHKSN